MTSDSRPRVVVVGLGPAGSELVTVGARAAIERISHRFVRTRRHPSADVVGVDARSFDDLYETAATIDGVYAAIVEVLVGAARKHGEVLYAVPGSPAVAEDTVERLLDDGRITTEVMPALSFLDLAWVRLGVDPVGSAIRLIDGHHFAVEAAGERGPLLVGQCDSRAILSEIKLALDPDTGGIELGGGPGPKAADGDSGVGVAAARGPSVTVLQRLGLPGENVLELQWSDLDRDVEPDHLTSLWIPHVATPVGREVAAFAEIVRRLRADCPWDREQTHHSLRRHLLEEAYEVLEAIDHLDTETGEGYAALEEELGDLLFQVVFHSTLAAEEGQFTLADVARGIADKLVGRHPHVFGNATAHTAAEVAARWEQIKRVEKGRASVMDGIPVTLPALLYALKVQQRAAAQGVDWRDLLDGAEAGGVGGRLLGLVDDAGRAGVDPETELRLAAEHVRDRFRAGNPRRLVSALLLSLPIRSSVLSSTRTA